MSVCLTVCLINGSPDFTFLAEEMCIATEGMKSKGVKWNIHWRMLIDDFIMWEHKWPEKAVVMMYCLTIHWSGTWIQTAAFISLSSPCPRTLVWVSTVWCLSQSRKTDESRYDVCPVLLLPLHHQASTARVMMMRPAWTGAYYFTMVKDNGPASYCARESARASNYCL